MLHGWTKLGVCTHYTTVLTNYAGNVSFNWLDWMNWMRPSKNNVLTMMYDVSEDEPMAGWLIK